MRDIFQQSQFKKDIKKIKKSGKHNLNELLEVIELIAKDIVLTKKYFDHKLSGEWSDFRECHIRSDWLLIYLLEPGKLILVRTGNHSELFG